ncbi:MAG: ACP S-malonyltransferase [Betaproteobacteria bacterium]|nr:MAG: ACP S-malonyltransferase [Betaproteobacteria bacterium]
MKLGMVFPGQGSQSVGMLAGYDAYPVVRETLAEAGAILGQDLWALAADGPAEELNRTVNTQPLMLAADIAVYRAWRAAGGTKPAIVAGHSLGEYAALVAAEALELNAALPLVRFRAQAMQEAVPAGVGAMAAIMGADDESIIAACAEAAQGQVVEPVNFNAPGQTVIAGHREAVERAIAAAKAKGAKRGVLLPVSAPFHSSLLKAAAERLAAYLVNVPISTLRIRVLHNVDARPAETPEAIRSALAKQAASPVRWVQTVQAFVTEGVTHIVECGPGQVLTGLCKRIAADVTVMPLADGGAIDAASGALK